MRPEETVMEGWTEGSGFVVRPLLWVFPRVILEAGRLERDIEGLRYRVVP